MSHNFLPSLPFFQEQRMSAVQTSQAILITVGTYIEVASVAATALAELVISVDVQCAHITPMHRLDLVANWPRRQVDVSDHPDL